MLLHSISLFLSFFLPSFFLFWVFFLVHMEGAMCAIGSVYRRIDTIVGIYWRDRLRICRVLDFRIYARMGE